MIYLKLYTKTFPKFSIQVDERTDISKKTQLFSEVHFVNSDSITEEYFVKNFQSELLVRKFFAEPTSFLQPMVSIGLTASAFVLMVLQR